MIALDTNVLVRFLVRDDDRQAELARRVLQAAVREDDACFVSDVVICEVIWVLRRSYKLPKSDVVSLARRLLAARHLTFESRDLLSRALVRYETRRGDFADYVIGERGRLAGASAVVTFDKALVGEPGFVAPRALLVAT